MVPHVRPKATSVAAHLSGATPSWHGQITADGPFKPETGRYHLYIGLFCPFAQRVNIVRHLKGLQELLPMSVVKPYPKGDETGWPGWVFPTSETEYAGATPDALFGAAYLHEIYFRADPQYAGRFSVPVLWDKTDSTIVNNESAELMRDLQTAFNGLLPERDAKLTLYPTRLRARIDAETTWLQRDLCVGVYRAGFATTQEEYDAAVPRVFAALNRLERLIHRNGGPFVLGDALTELDVRAYATVVRFDVVYVQHFKCNLGTIRHDYPQVNNWLRHLYWDVPGFRETTDFRHIKENYTKSHRDINLRGITPMGPWPDVEADYESDVAKVPVGGVSMPVVLELEKTLET
ncbi:glutathione transferase [Grosmannia clavigera kw1407]|uniref:Glutathione transferase n=1 Tax=Grosmannia clavigera (strain kw1407 / UAMH 11150) TaxID=655863 RepID=F0XE74_GROCL|nr:glutathione transferase [Grosmannia clavigera kw1407]EFX03899.1 glutathione transferase [Grosmannia clavigera kw1407]